MNRLRTKWGMRGVAALLLASLLPVTFAMAAHAARHTTSFADWVRLQLREPADEAVARALETASQARAPSLATFLTVFVDAYERQQPERPLAAAFSAGDLSNDALISHLQGRFLGFVGEAVLPRLTLAAAQIVAKDVLNRGAAPPATLIRHDRPHPIRAASIAAITARGFVPSLRALCTAQPLGP